MSEQRRINDTRLAALAPSGMTARQIAADLGVSPQAVYARLAVLGLREAFDSAQGPRQRGATAVRARLYGLPEAEYLDLKARDVISAYCRQKDTAKSRGIEWRFTFTEWWRVWQESGKWELRGRTKGLCGWEMSRPGDVGPYSPENVVIVPHRVNMADVHQRLRKQRPSQAARTSPPDPKYAKQVMTVAANVERAASMFRDGCTFTEIGAAVGVHRSAVRSALIKHGVFVPGNVALA